MRYCLRTLLIALALASSLLGCGRGLYESSGPPPKPFAAFTDPFLNGMAQQRSYTEVVRYSFEAFEAWAREHGFPRQPEQTPLEYAQLVGQQQTAVAREAATLAELYSRCLYGKDSPPRANIEPLRQLWTQLRGS